MPPPIYVVTPIIGLRKSERRALAFLTCDEEAEINARDVFDDLDDKKVREVMSRFDYWIDGKKKDEYFHGFPNEPENDKCFTFKWKKKNVDQRFYGFLSNPMPKSNPGFQVCVLVSHTPKSQKHTDPAHKKLVNTMRQKQQVMEAIKIAFPDAKAGDKSWQN